MLTPKGVSDVPLVSVVGGLANETICVPAALSPRPLIIHAGGWKGRSVLCTPVHMGLSAFVQVGMVPALDAVAYRVASARKVARRSGPASCWRWAIAKRSETNACIRA